MGAYGDYIKAARESGDPEAFVKQNVSPAEATAMLGRLSNPTEQVHNAAPVNIKLKNYVAPTGNVNRASEYYQAGAKARASGTNKFGRGGQFLATSSLSADEKRQQDINRRQAEADASYAEKQGWDATTPGSVTQGRKKQNWLDRALERLSGRIASDREDPTNLANENFGRGNIDLNSRPALQNEDGSYSTIDSVSFNINGKEVLVPKVIFKDGEWQHVDEATALQHYYDTGEYLGIFDTPQEADAYAQQLHEDQAKLYGLDQQPKSFQMPSYDSEAAKQRQKDQQYMLWQFLHPNKTIEDYYKIFPDRAPSTSTQSLVETPEYRQWHQYHPDQGIEDFYRLFPNGISGYEYIGR